MHDLRNHLSREENLRLLQAEPFKRVTLSFYRYVTLHDPVALRHALFAEWRALGVLGRIYLAGEGINAQLSVPEPQFQAFRAAVDARPEFAGVPFKIAIEGGESFWKLTIKVRDKLVADGLAEGDIDWGLRAPHLDAEGFNRAIQDGAVVVDMRNAYESRIGHFEGALCPPVETFKEELPLVRERLRGKEEQKIILYCTGGIRCEKAGAYLRRFGFKNVAQLQGGIIQYAHEAREKGLECKFKGANYVFDGRTAERVTDDVLAVCEVCGAPCDTYSNCCYAPCNRQFIQCIACSAASEKTCSTACNDKIKTSVQRPAQK